LPCSDSVHSFVHLRNNPRNNPRFSASWAHYHAGLFYRPVGRIGVVHNLGGFVLKGCTSCPPCYSQNLTLTSHMAEPLILQERTEHLLVLRLNRPAQLNALTADLLVQLRDAIDNAGNDPAVRALLITGQGRAFCAGQDLADPFVAPEAGRDKDIGHLIDHYYIPLALSLRQCRVPTVCALNGVAAGAGVSLALGCDIVLASDAAILVLGFNKIGLIPDAGATWLLPRLVGRAKALELALLGDKISATDAELLGLVARTVPADHLMGTALDTAKRLASLPTRALVATRRLFDDAMQQGFEPALRAESRMQSQLGFSRDYHEGVTAFQQKRPPRFSDR
jgi:2-(1,2-epoxy-1,2-dihydrophenyl)acetyl-CoA isomerase